MTTDNRAAEICDKIARDCDTLFLNGSNKHYERMQGAKACAAAIRSQSAQEPVAHKWSADGVCTVCDTDSESHQYINAKKFGFDTCVAHPVTTPAAQEPVAWRYRWPTDGYLRWDYSTSNPGFMEETSAIVEPLYAHPVTTTAEQGEKVSVPREPTPEMLQAGLEESRKHGHIEGCGKNALPIGYELFAAGLIYRAMLAASEQGES